MLWVLFFYVHSCICLSPQLFEYVDDLLHKLAKELFTWLAAVAKQSDKYADKIKIVNYSYFEAALLPLNLPILENFVTYAAQQKVEAMARYVNWMVSYEFPALSALAVRMDGVGHRVNEEELSLYIRRKDVLNVVKEVEVVKTLEVNISSLRRRLVKHFASEYEAVSAPLHLSCVVLVCLFMFLSGTGPAVDLVAADPAASGAHPDAAGGGRVCQLPDQAGRGPQDRARPLRQALHRRAGRRQLSTTQWQTAPGKTKIKCGSGLFVAHITCLPSKL